MALLDVPDRDLKMLRETLCEAQLGLAYRPGDMSRHNAHVGRLQQLVHQIDVFRPLGPDGKHDDRHTPFCGCDFDPNEMLPRGLCGNRDEHEPHKVTWTAVANGPMWCHADQTQRQPFAGEQRQRAARREIP